MNDKKGAASNIVLVALGVLAVGLVIYLIVHAYRKPVSAAPEAQTPAPEDAPQDISADSPDAGLLVSFDSNVSLGFSRVYYRRHTVPDPKGGVASKGLAKTTTVQGSDPTGAGAASATPAQSDFTVVPGADPATFSQITTVSVPNPVQGGEAQVTYYRDNDQVFVAQSTTDSSGDTDTSIEPVQADPATFQILNDTYAKDKDHVYVVSWVCEGDTCSLVLQIVQGADPDTFHTFPPTQMQQSDGTGTITADAADQSHLFNDGAIVDVITAPGSGTKDMTPILISP